MMTGSNGSNGTDKKFVDSATKANERRTFPRYALSTEAEVVEAQSRNRMNARVSDLSRMGCYVEMMSPFPLGSNLKMRILKNKTPFLAQGPGAFSSAEQIRLREKWIDELSGVLPFEDADSDEGLPALATQVS